MKRKHYKTLSFNRLFTQFIFFNWVYFVNFVCPYICVLHEKNPFSEQHFLANNSVLQQKLVCIIYIMRELLQTILFVLYCIGEMWEQCYILYYVYSERRSFLARKTK